MSGFIIGDTITLTNGLTSVNSYAFIDAHPLHLQKNIDGTYKMTGNCSIYKDQTSYSEGKDAIKSISFVSDSITYIQLSSANPYAVAYQELKSQFTTTSDV